MLTKKKRKENFSFYTIYGVFVFKLEFLCLYIIKIHIHIVDINNSQVLYCDGMYF